MKLSPLQNQLLGFLGAALNIMSNGSVHGYPAVLLNHLKGSNEIVFNTNSVSNFASIVGGSVVIGSLMAPVIMNRFGRRPGHICSTIPVTIGWIMTALAPNITVLMLARLLHGIGLGMRAPIAGVLVAEYSDPKYRGAFLSSFSIFMSLGIFTGHFIGSFLSWRITAFVLALIPLTAMTITLFCPESPSWLAAKGDFDRCRESFIRLRGDDEKSKEELKLLILSQSNTVREEGMKFWKAFRHKYFYLPAFIVFNLEVMFEFGGGHMMAAYINMILQSILNKENVAWESTVIDVFRVLSAVLAVLFVKQWKRKTLLHFGTLGTTATLVTIAIYTYLRKSGVISDIRSFATILFVVYIMTFGLCISPLAFTSAYELFPLKCRSLGLTFTTLSIIPLYIISLKTAPHMFEAVGVEGSFVIYSGLLMISYLFIVMLMPETKDRTLQEIESHFIKEPLTANDENLEMTTLKNT